MTQCRGPAPVPLASLETPVCRVSRKVPESAWREPHPGGALLRQPGSAHTRAHPSSAERGLATEAPTAVLAPPCRVSARLVRARLPEPLQV